MPHRIPTWLEDIQTSINYIEEDLGPNRNFHEYQQNRRLRQLIERNLEIIGEAMKRILEKQPDIPITHARRIVNLRNLVIHTYDNISDSTIWAIVCNDLPKLKAEVDELLANT